jgi:hypothetical protein
MAAIGVYRHYISPDKINRAMLACTDPNAYAGYQGRPEPIKLRLPIRCQSPCSIALLPVRVGSKRKDDDNYY